MLSRARSLSFECTDSSTLSIDAMEFIQGKRPRNPDSTAARLAKQFQEQNKGILNNFDVIPETVYDGNHVKLFLKTGLKIGAIPLLSPNTGRPDYKLVIQPRFDWAGIGGMLAQMGWRVTPTLLTQLPLVPGSERKIPPWVLSSVILLRIQALLDRMERRFELSESLEIAPRGTVNWTRYATTQLPRAHFLKVPCQYPDLRDDRYLKSAVHYTLRRQLTSLESQRSMASIVIHLIDLCHSLIQRVAGVPPQKPVNNQLSQWYSGILRSKIFHDGIQAVEWTIDDRGLAGISDLSGLAWVMPMDQFFESWVETMVEQLARRMGGILHVGRKQQTLVPIQWLTPSRGTQKYLLPDIVLEREDCTFVFDAKYKRHWEEFNLHSWSQIEQEIHEQHRHDLLQVLAYTTLKSSPRVVACLVYPCKSSTWKSLQQRGQLIHRAVLPSEGRNIELILTALPMHARLEDPLQVLKQALTME